MTIPGASPVEPESVGATQFGRITEMHISTYLDFETRSISMEQYPKFIYQYIIDNLTIIIFAYIISFIVYMYLFTTPIFVDHTFSNMWFVPFPSHRTTTVGRWFADIIDYFLGNTGDPSFQMSLAAGIQVLNGLLFSLLIEIKRKIRILFSILFISLHPAFLDYYSFSRDHVGFTLGDALCLLGVISIYKIRGLWWPTLLASFCFVLALSIYQPKISFITVLMVLMFIKITVASAATERISTRSTLALMQTNFLRYALPAILALLVAAALSFVSSELVMSRPEAEHTKINGAVQIYRGILASYPKILSYYSTLVDYLPDFLHLAPIVVILPGLAILVARAFRSNWLLGSSALFLAALLPPALQLSFIVNDQTPTAARILGRVDKRDSQIAA